MNKIDILFYVAAATTAIAGIIHVVLGYDSDRISTQILFVIGGIAQIFWVVPMVRRWGPCMVFGRIRRNSYLYLDLGNH